MLSIKRFLWVGSFLFCLTLFFGTASLTAQPASPSSIGQEYTILSLEVKGNRTADRLLIRNVSGLVVGAKLDAGQIQDAIRRIYGLGLFSDVRIDAELAGDSAGAPSQKMIVTIVVVEYPRIRRIDIEGNRKIKSEEIHNKLTIKQGQIAGPALIQTNVNQLQTLYSAKGYYLATVEGRIEPVADRDEQVVKFRIREGEKIKLKYIEFTGNSAFASKKLRKQIHDGEFKKERYDEDKEKIIEFYKKNGYSDAVIVSDTTWVDSTLRWMHALITVSEGKRFRFGSVTFDGQKLFEVTKLASQLKYNTGDIFNQKKYEESIGNLYALYQEEGYLYARIEDERQTQDTLVNLKYTITEGVPAKINRIRIEGNHKTKDKVIRRELSVRPGQTFRRSLLFRSVRDVMQLNYFSNVTPDYTVLENGDIDLILKVEEKPTGQIQVGAGYSAQDRLVGTVGLGIPNLFGNGQSMTLNLDFGARRNSLQFSFTEPWFRDTPTSVGFDLFRVNRIFSTRYTEERTGLSLRLGRRLRWPDNYFRVYWNYRLERLKLKEFNDPADVLNQIKWPKTNSSTGLTVLRDSRDLPQFATKGAVFSYSPEFSGGPLAGDYFYHKHLLDISKFQHTFWKFVLVGKLHLGWVDNPRGDERVSPSELFYAGGTDPDGMVRGYVDREVGPFAIRYDTTIYRNTVDTTLFDTTYTPRVVFLGARSVLTYNLELQFPIVHQQIYGLLFADAGNSWLSGKQVSPFRDLLRSAGFGVRLVVPGIGIVGFDLGYAFDQRSSQGVSAIIGKRWRPHFQVGTTF